MNLNIISYIVGRGPFAVMNSLRMGSLFCLSEPKPAHLSGKIPNGKSNIQEIDLAFFDLFVLI